MLSRREWIGRLLTLGSVTGVIGRGRAAEPPQRGKGRRRQAKKP